ncbi:MAG: thioesterase [Planctomycetaceae bacterium]|nr:thioesterase [Planctomycetaceae bacterium]
MEMRETRPARDDANHCFVCGGENSLGLKVCFRLDGDVCRGEFTPRVEHSGYDGITHGGIVFSLLDDVMANWMFLQGLRCYTAKCEIRFSEALPIGSLVLLESRVLRRKQKLVVMEGRAVRAENGKTVASCQASFIMDTSE